MKPGTYVALTIWTNTQSGTLTRKGWGLGKWWEIQNILKYRATFGSTVYRWPIIYSEITMKMALMLACSFHYQKHTFLWSIWPSVTTKWRIPGESVQCFCLLSFRWWDTASIRWTRGWAPSIMRLFTHCWTLSAPDTEKRLEMLCCRDWRGSNRTDSEGFSIIQNIFAR